MSSSASWSFILPAAALAIPVCFALAAIVMPRAASLLHLVRAAAWAHGLALTVAAGHALTALAPLAALRALAPARDSLGVRLDFVTHVMLVLITGIGVVIARYSRSYMAGDPDQQRYARFLLATLATVSTLVVADNLLIFAVAWLSASVALHQLLVFYGDRVPARIAAHKKFLVSRLADVCLFAAIGLIAASVGSVDLGAIETWLAAIRELPAELHAAAVLLVIAAALKSAQLPFHGWLMQVMEAPTPVSALLHAGVVNVGGLLMIRLSPLMAHAEGAQLLLVCIGLMTTVVAVLVMSTRVSVKVALAWSTCAQMGFMLVECGLGAWHLALLHIVAHSLYKAHAFLSSGSAVSAWGARTLVTAPAWKSGRALAALTLACASVAASVSVFGALAGHADGPDASLVTLAVILVLSLAPFLSQALGAGVRPVRLALHSVGIAALYLAWHELARHALSPPAMSADMRVGWWLVLGAFSALFLVQTVLQARPHGWLARTLHPALFAGLYLDELFSRLVFRVWPPRFHGRASSNEPLAIAAPSEV